MKVIKEHVIAFRLTPEEFAEFEQAHRADPIVGVKSPGTLARKLALDFARGKLKWGKKKDKMLAPEVGLAAAP
jgi:hypothetical protein